MEKKQKKVEILLKKKERKLIKIKINEIKKERKSQKVRFLKKYIIN